jgi:thioredoxin 1
MTRNLFATARGPLRPTVLALLAALLAASGAIGQARPIYNENADAHAEVRSAIAEAAQEHKRIILDFGGNWCGDCQVLDIYFHQQPNADLLAQNFVLVDIDIGHMDKNIDVAQRYNVPLQKGVPALAVLDAHGRLLYSQTNGEFEKMRHMDPNSVTDFLERWKATRD